MPFELPDLSTFKDSISNTVSAGNQFLGGASDAISGLGNKISGFATSFNPSEARLKLAGLLSGATSSAAAGTVLSWANGAGIPSGNGVNGEDWRLRISVAPGAPVLYNLEGNNLLDPLYHTSGVVFPITPNIQTQHNAKYSATSLTHSNYDMHFYEGSSVSAILINGDFPIQNIEEGQYLLAAIYFFRAATKMYWGKDEYAGTPPPMVYLSGYGGDYFPDVPCVVTQFMHTLPADVDYISIPPVRGANGAPTRLPTMSTLQVTVQPIYSRSAVAGFDLDDFADGKMVEGGFL